MIFDDLQIYISSNSRNILLLGNYILHVKSWFGWYFGNKIIFHLNIKAVSLSILSHQGNNFVKCQIIFCHSKIILSYQYLFWCDFINLKLYLKILMK